MASGNCELKSFSYFSWSVLSPCSVVKFSINIVLVRACEYLSLSLVEAVGADDQNYSD